MEKKEELLQAITKKSFRAGEKTKVTCASALHIASEFNVEPSEVGDICNKSNIRITKCQLGCFE